MGAARRDIPVSGCLVFLTAYGYKVTIDPVQEGRVLVIADDGDNHWELEGDYLPEVVSEVWKKAKNWHRFNKPGSN